MKIIYRTVAVAIFLVGIIVILANIATPFIFVYLKGITVLNMIKAIILYVFFGAIGELIATAGLVLNFSALDI